jgi:hypothetical protein
MKPRRTEHGHEHGEAFCLMWYACNECGARERIWNSRDGVTPFGMGCHSCGGNEYLHSDFRSDEYAPNHQLHFEQRFWRDGTPDEAEAIMRKRIAQARGEFPLTDAEKAQLIGDARSGAAHEFQKGWPMIDVAGKRNES